MTNNPSNADPLGQTPEGTASSGQTPNPQGLTPSGKTPIDSLPPDIQEYIAGLRKEAEEANKAKKAEARAKQAAEEQRLREQGEFKTLAEKHEARVRELEPTAARFQAMAEKIRKQITTATKDWPAEIKAFYPGDTADIDQIQDWYERSQPLLEKLQLQARSSLPGNRPNPAPASPAGNRQSVIEANKQAFKKERSYGF